MSKIDKKNAIKIFFSEHFNCTDSAIENQLINFSNILEKNRGESIFYEGENALYIYYIIHGSVKLYRVNEVGKIASIKVLKKGDVFADIVLFEENRYPVNAESIAHSTLLCINSKKLKEIILSNIKLTESFIILLSKRIKYLVNKIDTLELESAENRLLNYLYEKKYQSKSNEFTLDISKKEIAEIIGIRTETFSRLLKKLSVEGVVKVQSKKIILLKN
jgi:CRP/FNR family transcriptional regulator